MGVGWGLDGWGWGWGVGVGVGGIVYILAQQNLIVTSNGQLYIYEASCSLDKKKCFNEKKTPAYCT